MNSAYIHVRVHPTHIGLPWPVKTVGFHRSSSTHRYIKVQPTNVLDALHKTTDRYGRLISPFSDTRSSPYVPPIQRSFCCNPALLVLRLHISDPGEVESVGRECGVGIRYERQKCTHFTYIGTLPKLRIRTLACYDYNSLMLRK